MQNCAITAAELWGIFWCLFTGWNLGYRNVWRETDSTSRYQLINQNVQPTQVHVALIKAIHGLLSEDCACNIDLGMYFVKLTDMLIGLAKFGHRLPLELNFFDSMPTCVSVDLFG